MSRPIIKLAVFLALALAAAYALNPSPEKHRASISDTLSARSELAALLRLGRVAAFLSEYHSLGVASYTTVNERVVSVGAFGLVHVRDRPTGAPGA